MRSQHHSLIVALVSVIHTDLWSPSAAAYSSGSRFELKGERTQKMKNSYVSSITSKYSNHEICLAWLFLDNFLVKTGCNFESHEIYRIEHDNSRRI